MEDPKETTGENTPESTGNAPIAPESPANSTPAETVTASDVGADLAASMPVPTANGTQTEIPGTESASNPSTNAISGKPVPDIRDKSGKQFDPAKHAVDSVGQPRFNKNGFFISKFIGNPAGRKQEPGAESATAASLPSPDGTPTGDDTGGTSPFVSPQSGKRDQYDQAAEMFLNVGLGVGSSFLGSGFLPEHKIEKITTGGSGLPDQTEEIVKYTAEGKQEFESLRLPLAAVLREKQTVGLTPTQMFMASLAAYVAKKSAKPTVRERFTLLFLKVRSWFNKPKQ